MKDEPPMGRNSIKAAYQLLRRGKIVAIKGLSGYHLAVDATNARAVKRLRERKGREEKPLAIMVKDVTAVRKFCEVSRAEEDLLQRASRPIVLLRKLQVNPICEEVAPHNRFLGVFLPYTPLHHLLFSLGEGAKEGLLALIMTSGNLSEEPLAYQDEEAAQRLAGIADRILLHNREIHVRSDDSVSRMMAGREVVLRRSRGYAPMPIRLKTSPPYTYWDVGQNSRIPSASLREKTHFSVNISGILRIMRHSSISKRRFDTFSAFWRSIHRWWPLICIPTIFRPSTP
jgi:hydrogenase maturation protein HypF